MNKNMVYLGRITESDLRRALLFYLVGLCSYLAFLSLGVGDFAAGLAADPGTADPEFTPQWIMAGLFTISAIVVVFSQLWYLRIKHIWAEYRSIRKALRFLIIEPLVILWAVLATVYSTIPSLRPSEGLFVLTLIYSFVLGIPMYCLFIVSWNIKCLIDRRRPDMDRHAKIIVSCVLGLASSAVIMFLLTFAVLALLNSVGLFS